jgi:hypothetical protein
MRDEGWEQIAPDLRFGLRGCGVGLVLAYTLAFPLKWAGLMPGHLTWLGLAVAPAAMFGLLAAPFAGALWLGRRWWLVFVPATVLCCAAMLGVIWWGRGR